MKQITLAALYGQKRNEIKDLISPIWKQIEGSKLRRVFKKYHINQIHSTLIGMEKIIGFESSFNANIWEIGGRKKEMNFSNFYANVEQFFPMTIQFGGFKDSFKEFMSLSETPYNRSFQINWNSKRVILMGWPMQENLELADNKLVELRQNLYEKNNIQHKYNDDNDFYLVLGQIENLELFNDKELDILRNEAEKLEKEIRDELVNSCKRIQISMDELFLVRYKMETLELNTSEAWNLKRVKNNSGLIERLYRID